VCRAFNRKTGLRPKQPPKRPSCPALSLANPGKYGLSGTLRCRWAAHPEFFKGQGKGVKLFISCWRIL